MPILEFKCANKLCNHVQEILTYRKTEEVTDTRDCPKCGRHSYLIFSRPNLNTEFPSQCGSATASMSNFVDPAKKRGGLRGRII